MVDIAQRLQDCADDPMWANYAEVSQELLREAAQYIRELEQDAARLAEASENAADAMDGLMKWCAANAWRLPFPQYDYAAVAKDKLQAAIDAARKEKGHG